MSGLWFDMPQHKETCLNPRCAEELRTVPLVPLCPSCQFLGKTALVIGAILGGILVRIFG